MKTSEFRKLSLEEMKEEIDKMEEELSIVTKTYYGAFILLITILAIIIIV